jgi:hypothetical protein
MYRAKTVSNDPPVILKAIPPNAQSRVSSLIIAVSEVVKRVFITSNLPLISDNPIPTCLSSALTLLSIDATFVPRSSIFFSSPLISSVSAVRSVSVLCAMMDSNKIKFGSSLVLS